MITQRHFVALPFDGPAEDRACHAVAFAWSWTEFPLVTDGESRSGQIHIKPLNIEDQTRFREEFFPALNADLVLHGHAPCSNIYSSGPYFYDLDNLDGTSFPGLMGMRKFLSKNGVTREELKELFGTDPKGRQARFVARVREINGRWYEDRRPICTI